MSNVDSLELLVKLPEDIKRNYLNPYDNNEIDIHAKAQCFFHPLNQSQDSVLFERITENKSDDPKVIAYPDRKSSVQLHHVFVKCWETMQSQERKDSVIYRGYWLGDSWMKDEINEKKVSDFLVSSLAEIVRRYKANIGMHQLIPFVSAVDVKHPHTYRSSESYQEWYKENKSRSKYNIQVVEDFASGAKIKEIYDVVFGVKTPVITKEEIERVYAELAKNLEPKVQIHNLGDNKDKFDKLADGINALVNLQSQQLEKSSKG